MERVHQNDNFSGFGASQFDQQSSTGTVVMKGKRDNESDYTDFEKERSQS